MEATKTENETIQRYLADLRIKGHTKGVQVSFFRGDKGISHSCNSAFCLRGLLQEGCQYI